MDDLLGRQAPHSLEAEQAVLGSILIDSRCINDVIGAVRAEDFYLQTNREIFETVYEMFSYSQSIDPVTVLDKMRERGVYDDQNSQKYVMQLMEITPTAANAKQYAQIVHDKAMLRNLSDAASDIVGMVNEGVGTAQDMLEAAEKKIYSLRRGNTNESLEHVGTILLKVFDRLTELSQSGSDISGISTGLRDLDKVISGLNKTDLMILAARPGMGKTSMALNIALNVAKRYPKKTVAIFSLEMSKQQLVTRLISNESFVDNKKLTTGKLSVDEWSKIGIASTALSQTDLRVDDNPSITVAEMNAKLRRIDDLSLVIIDYLQLMTSTGTKQNYSGENRQQVVSDISRSLKIMAKELNVPVICLSQLSRSNENRGEKQRKPMLSDLRESGAIEQDADEVLFLYREDYYNKETENQNVAECIVAKNRHGETGTVELQWLPQFTTFADREWRYDEG
ncbi:MAG: replicative DNA helicase [Oscillospiraceae bacterium]|nr:replicative DNA helicase [Oscillospiraceae bacterium]